MVSWEALIKIYSSLKGTGNKPKKVFYGILMWIENRQVYWSYLLEFWWEVTCRRINVPEVPTSSESPRQFHDSSCMLCPWSSLTTCRQLRRLECLLSPVVDLKMGSGNLESSRKFLRLVFTSRTFHHLLLWWNVQFGGDCHTTNDQNIMLVYFYQLDPP